LKAPVLLTLGAALVFGACDTNAALDHAVLYGTWFYDGETFDRTAVISANRYRLDTINGTGNVNYLEVAIDSWEEAVNDDADKETYPAGYTITGTVTAQQGFDSYPVGSSYTITFYTQERQESVPCCRQY
jgi:hypothetical protein